MFRRIRIKGFRSCQDVLLENLGSLTVLMGRNGSGKTNILRAIEWVAGTAGAGDTFRDRLARYSPINRALDVEIECNDTLYRYTRKRFPDNAKDEGEVPKPVLKESLAAKGSTSRWEKIIDRNGSQAYVVGRDEPIALGGAAPCISALAALLPETEPVQRHLCPLLAFFRGVRYYPLDESNESAGLDHSRFISDKKYCQWVQRYLEGGEAEDSTLMKLLYSYNESISQFHEIQALLGPKGLGLIDKIRVNRFYVEDFDDGDGVGRRRSHHQVFFHLGESLGEGVRDQYAHLSLGTRRVVHLIVSLILDRSSTMLIEHPEDGIHRGLVRKLVDLLRTNTTPTQIIMSSHSALVMNEIAAQDVRLVSIHRGSTRVRALNSKETTAAKNYIDTDGTLGDFLDSVEE